MKITIFAIFSSAINGLSSEEEAQLQSQPKLERTKSAIVELGSGESINIPLHTKKIHLLKKGQVYPKTPEPVTHAVSDGVETTARRTPIGMESLEGLLEEFPDGIKDTISKLLDA